MFVLFTGCGKSPTNPSPPPALTLPESARAFCVQETNRYRSVAGSAAVSGSAQLDAYADTAARADAQSGEPHGYSTANATPPYGENEVLRQPLANYGSLSEVVRVGLAGFWNEGPNGPHHRIMVNPAYSLVGCGAYVSGGIVTFVQHFRR